MRSTDLYIFVVFLSICTPSPFLFFFFFNDTATTEIYTLSLHDALPICRSRRVPPPPHSSGRDIPWRCPSRPRSPASPADDRSEEHTSELQSPCNLVCRLLLEKKKKKRCPKLYDKHNRSAHTLACVICRS